MHFRRRSQPKLLAVRTHNILEKAAQCALEPLERRRLLAYSATLSGNTATFLGNSSTGNADDLTFNTSGGWLSHTRENDAGFNSALDFDSTVAGDQKLAAAAASRVNITPGNGHDTVQLGGSFYSIDQPASNLLAAFSINHNANPSDGAFIKVVDSDSAVANTFEVTPGSVKATGINVSYTGNAAYDGVAIFGSKAADTFNVLSSPDMIYQIYGHQPASAPGDVLNFDAQLIDATDIGYQITQPGKKRVEYQDIESVNIFNETPDVSQLVVKNTNNIGANSLRNAITAANLLPGPDTITFNIPGGGVHTILDSLGLPEITDAVTIDATTQPGFDSSTHVPVIELDGSAAGSSGSSGFFITAGNSTIRGFAINGFNGSGISLNSSGNTVVGNYLGLQPDGVTAAPNAVGVNVKGSSDNNRIGGTTPADRNVISGNSFDGVAIGGPGAENNRIEGNYIGTDASGTKARGNGRYGVEIRSANNIVGGTASGAGNLISANGDSGIYIASFFQGIEFPAPFNVVQGNRIGTDVTGTAALRNDIGITVDTSDTTIGGATAAARNVISGNGTGIEVGDGVHNLRIIGNYIGTDVTGNAKVKNSSDGISLNPTGFSIDIGVEIGGAAPGEGNVISGNGSDGIEYNGTASANVLVRGNRIGTNAAGTAALGNGQNGIRQVDGDITIGGADPGSRNIISGNGFNGVALHPANSDSAVVYGNFIGTDVTGTIDFGNGGLGIDAAGNNITIGGAAPGQGNLISGNDSDGIFMFRTTFLAFIQGNRIGTDVTGTLPLGNGGDGIEISGATHNNIGGFGVGQGNVIAFNGGHGMHLHYGQGSFPTSNLIYGNSIFSNGLLGIDLDGDGVTPNDAGDADTGSNELTNTPVLTAAFTNTTGVAVTGKLEAKQTTDYFVQFFASPGADPSGFGEGKLLLGTIELLTNGSGVANFAAEFPFAIPAGQVITATATEQDGTSEFSNAVTVTGNPPRISINDVTVTEGNGVPVSATFTIKLSDAVSAPVTVDFTTADGTAVAQGDYLSKSGTVTFNPGETTRTVTITVNPDAIAEGTETFVVKLSNAQIADISDNQGVGTILDGAVSPPPPPPPVESSVYLSSLNPTQATNGWGAYERDKSNGESGANDGNTIKLNGVTYAKGLGVHAGSDLRYNLGSNYTRFTSFIGVDDEVGNNGNVIFQVFADGVKLFESTPMTGASATQQVDVNVTGRNQLQLVVLSNGSLSFDHADWADAKVLSNSIPPLPPSPPPPPPPAGNSVFVSSLNTTFASNGYGQFEKDKSNGESGANDGKTIKLNGTSYARGLGVHANSELRYALSGGNYTRFTADIGIDDEVGNNGSVIFQVWADGVKLFDSGVMTGASATQQVDVNLTGRSELKLLVLGNGSIAYDHADWADAKLYTNSVPPPPGISFLSDRTPTFAANGFGQFERDKSNGHNGANDGNTITLNGQTYAKGLGVHASSDLRYLLNAGFTRFTADVGIDDEAGTNGSAIFQVWADGVKLFDSGVMTATSVTQQVDVNVTGKNELKLLVLSNGSDVWDHGDWADAKLHA